MKRGETLTGVLLDSDRKLITFDPFVPHATESVEEKVQDRFTVTLFTRVVHDAEDAVELRRMGFNVPA